MGARRRRGGGDDRTQAGGDVVRDVGRQPDLARPGARRLRRPGRRGQAAAASEQRRDGVRVGVAKARQENIDVLGMLPPGLALRKEREDLPRRAAALPSEPAVRALLEDFNDRVRPSGVVRRRAGGRGRAGRCRRAGRRVAGEPAGTGRRPGRGAARTPSPAPAVLVLSAPSSSGLRVAARGHTRRRTSASAPAPASSRATTARGTAEAGAPASRTDPSGLAVGGATTARCTAESEVGPATVSRARGFSGRTIRPSRA